MSTLIVSKVQSKRSNDGYGAADYGDDDERMERHRHAG